VSPAAKAKDISIEIDLDASVGPVLADPKRLQQITWNLLSNAVKFTPRGGTIAVRYERAGGSARLAVRDSGKGIAAAFLPHIFDAFRQADSSSTRLHGGLGLGLTIVRHLVELHGGTVRAESEGPGRGATFIVDLPVLVGAGDEVEGGEGRELVRVARGAGDQVLAGVRVLVVDDEPDTLEFVVAVFEFRGAEVRTARSVADALGTLEQFQPDVLVSDIGMPVEDGYDLMRKVRSRATDRGGAVPAVALTAYARDDDRQQALEVGYQVHLAKPVDPAELVRVVATLAGRSQEQDTQRPNAEEHHAQR
jgi:CheY-like chemotaxis protein